MNSNFRLLPVAALVAAIAGRLQPMPAADSPLVLARGEYNAAQSNPQVVSLAAGELRQAGDSLERANAASSKGEKDVVVDHLAYVASQQVKIARETARSARPSRGGELHHGARPGTPRGAHA